MKRYLKSGITSMIAILFASYGLTAETIEGQWESSQNNVQIQVEKTFNGIKTKRFDPVDCGGVICEYPL